MKNFSGMRRAFSILFLYESIWKRMFELAEFRIRLILVLTLCVGMVATSGGCLRRRMTINSNPPGATVYVDGRQLGKTPVSTDFTYYGTRNIRLEKDKYQTRNIKQKVSPPWYEFPPLDFFTETFSVGEIKNHHVWTYELQRQAYSPGDQILKRANEFAFEGSRIVNSDGSLGAPITAENYQKYRRPGIGENPDTGLNQIFSANGDPTESLAPSGETSVLTSEELPNSALTGVEKSQSFENAPARNNPNEFPTGSADWDSPNRYPHGN